MLLMIWVYTVRWGWKFAVGFVLLLLVHECGHLLAAECEAHNGLHLEVPELDANHYALDQTPCACGKTTPRISAPVAAENVRTARQRVG